MSDGEKSKLGFWGAVSISVGGMIGGGVFAVLGVVTTIAGAASWLAFMIVFGAMSYLAFRQRDHDEVTSVWPAIGVLGTLSFAVLLLWHLWTAKQGTFFVVVGVAVVVLGLEFLYFERESVVEGIETIEADVESIEGSD